MNRWLGRYACLRKFKPTIFVVLLGVTALTTGCARFTNPAVAESGPWFDPALEGRAHRLLARDVHVRIDQSGHDVSTGEVDPAY